MTVESTSKQTASALARASIAAATLFPSTSFPNDASMSLPDAVDSNLLQPKVLLVITTGFRVVVGSNDGMKEQEEALLASSATLLLTVFPKLLVKNLNVESIFSTIALYAGAWIGFQLSIGVRNLGGWRMGKKCTALRKEEKVEEFTWLCTALHIQVPFTYCTYAHFVF